MTIIMRFFVYQQSMVSKGKLWDKLVPVHQAVEGYHHLADTLRAGLNGTIDLSNNEFNLKGYEIRSRQNSIINHHKTNKEIFISNDNDRDDAGNSPLGAISESKISSHKERTTNLAEQALDYVESSSTLTSCIMMLVEKREEARKEYGVDPLQALYSALNTGNIESIESLQKICSLSSDIKEIVSDLLTSTVSSDDTNSEVKEAISPYVVK